MTILEMIKKFGNYRELSPGQYAGPCPECGGAVRFRIDLGKNAGKCQSCGFSLSGADDVFGKDSFPTDQMQQLVSDTYSRIRSASPQGALEWLDQNRPDVVGHLTRAGRAVDQAFEEGDETQLMRVLAAWEKWHVEAWKRFEERPKVMER